MTSRLIRLQEEMNAVTKDKEALKKKVSVIGDEAAAGLDGRKS